MPRYAVEIHIRDEYQTMLEVTARTVELARAADIADGDKLIIDGEATIDLGNMIRVQKIDRSEG